MPTRAPVIPPAAAPAPAPASAAMIGPAAMKGPDSRNGQRPDSYHPTQRSAQYRAAARACSRSLGSLCVLFVREIARSILVREKHRYVVLGESCGHELVGNINRLVLAPGHAEYRFFHFVTLFTVTDRLFRADCRLYPSPRWLEPWIL